MKALNACIALIISASANAELIQHTDQIAEVKFEGSSYELGLHVGTVAKEQILDGIDRYNDMLGEMLPGLNVISLAKGMQGQNLFLRLKTVSPDAANYIKGLADSLNRDPHLLLAVGMSDEAVLESQRNGGMGFLQDKPASERCTVMGISDGQGRAWAQANFDYMGINYEGLIVLNHIDDDGKHRIIQTWAGLIPYGGVNKGGQPILMNTMADEGKVREVLDGEIISATSTPSYYLSWEAYNTESADELVEMMAEFPEYSAFFSYTLVDANERVLNIENHYNGQTILSSRDRQAHANHSTYQPEECVKPFTSQCSIDRQNASEEYMKTADVDTSKEKVQAFAESKPLWKGRGKYVGTVTSTHFRVNGKLVDMYIKTDDEHPEVHIRNH
ncbi:C45 family autoproteolytic acyltransferase/hydolase [Agaribacterium haliotis]|uniref:C45 family autoproteolytic acyltransferase/hydolase n=1 Tax=Agaribacterium haliotis TaxID=2013869 RepID=UPI000BB55423|nr:C45 family autoproteolytic acyltransferase/hydolase [Agaribacterium haliotis]